MTVFERLWRRGAWPWSTPPTVPAGTIEFHCHACRTPVADDATICPECGEKLQA